MRLQTREGPENELTAALQRNQVVQYGHVGQNRRNQIGENLARMVVVKQIAGLARQRVVQLVALADDFLDLRRRDEGEPQPVCYLTRDGFAATAVLMRESDDRQ